MYDVCFNKIYIVYIMPLCNNTSFNINCEYNRDEVPVLFSKNFKASDKRERDRISADKSYTHALPALANMCWLDLGFYPFLEKRKIATESSPISTMYIIKANSGE